jgi:hypothetical protein
MQCKFVRRRMIMSQISRVYRVQHGSSQFLRVWDENAWWVVEQIWQQPRGGLLNIWVVGRFDNEEEAFRLADELNAREAEREAEEEERLRRME